MEEIKRELQDLREDMLIQQEDFWAFRVMYIQNLITKIES
jgi:hypothetical protein